MHKLLALLLLFCCVFLNKVPAQVQRTDFTFTEGDKHSNPKAFTAFNDLFLFKASTTTEGSELWVSDGTAANTNILKDINPGSAGGVFSPHFVVLGDQLFFIANDGEYGNQLWATKGTSQSTKRISNLPGIARFTTLTLVGDQIFFLITRSNSKMDVWKSDGTQDGTQLVKGDIAIGHSPSFEGSANQLFFFTFQDPDFYKPRVWRSDGSEAGTFPVTGDLEGSGASPHGKSELTQYIVFEDELYFVASSYNLFSSYENMGIIKTDGSLEGTQAVKGLGHASTYINMAGVIEINQKLYFSLFEADYNHLHIWETDGTPSGSKVIYDIFASDYFMPSNLSSDGSRLVFTGPGTDNTTALLTLSTETYKITEIKQLVADLKKSVFYPSISNVITRLSDNLFHIVLETHNYAREIWFTDLTAMNTAPNDILKNSLEPPHFYNGTYYFSGYSEGEGQELWRADPTFSDQELFMNINQAGRSFESYSSFAALDDQIFFPAADAKSGFELWTYQQSTDEVSMVKDIQAGEKPSSPSNFIRFKDYIYFTARTENQNSILFRSDGTTEGTLDLSEVIEKRDYGTIFPQIVPAKEQVYFLTILKNNHSGLCATDGTDSWFIKDLGANSNNAPLYVSEMVAIENKVLFSVSGEGEDLWISDGTEGGTIKLRDLFEFSHLTAANGKVYFVASETYREPTELWQSDGTASGTTKISNNSGEAFSRPGNLTFFNDQLVFSAFTEAHGTELWKTDGTPEGTVMITDIRPGTASGVSSTGFAILDGFLYFSANDGINGLELWKTDGTAAGTAMVSDIYSGEIGAKPKNLFSTGDILYFSAYTPETGYELWSSEGTASSTRQVYDLIEGPQGSEPADFMLLGNELYFTAETRHAGRQLWQATDKKVTALTSGSKSDELKVYPNPTADYLYIDSEGQPIKSMQLFNINGQVISLPRHLGSGLNVAHLPAGLYILTLEAGNKTFVRKFIKK